MKGCLIILGKQYRSNQIVDWRLIIFQNIFSNHLQFFVDGEGSLSIGAITKLCSDKEIFFPLIFGLQFTIMFYHMGQLQIIMMGKYMLKEYTFLLDTTYEVITIYIK